MHWTKKRGGRGVETPAPEMPTRNIVPAFHMSLDNLETGTKRTVKELPASAMTHLACEAWSLLRILFLRSHCPPIFPWLPVPVRHAPHPRGFLALTRLFQHDCWASKEDIFDTNEVFPPQIALPTLSYVAHLFLPLLPYIISPQILICFVFLCVWFCFFFF